jgi:hypothetical protein
VLSGRYTSRSHTKAPTFQLTGRSADGTAFTYDLAGRSAHSTGLATRWAKSRIRDLEDAFDRSRDELSKELAVAVSLAHHVLSRFTAFVAVDEESQEIEASGQVTQPHEAPYGWATANTMYLASAGGGVGLRSQSFNSVRDGGVRGMVSDQSSLTSTLLSGSSSDVYSAKSVGGLSDTGWAGDPSRISAGGLAGIGGSFPVGGSAGGGYEIAGATSPTSTRVAVPARARVVISRMVLSFSGATVDRDRLSELTTGWVEVWAETSAGGSVDAERIYREVLETIEQYLSGVLPKSRAQTRLITLERELESLG